MSLAVQDKETLLRQLTAHREQIKSFGVISLGLFGSFTTVTKVRAGSDVDLFVEFDPNKKTYDNFFDLSEYLETLLNRKVELITLQSLSKYIGPHILKQVVHVTL